MILVLRAFLGIAGLLALVIALGFWFRPDALAAAFGIAPGDALGYSTLRADFGALFGAVGVLSLVAAVRNSARMLTAPLLLIGIGFSGRLLTIAMSGYESTMLQPMAVEIVLISLFAAGRNLLPKQ
ncbi:MAG: DUF4345 family protein [Hyphomonadaceae bacterium]|nr:DUF4345 family protein [Hyphomonadaceae bacterium]